VLKFQIFKKIREKEHQNKIKNYKSRNRLYLHSKTF